MHFTEMVDGECREGHFCQKHAEEYLTKDPLLQKQLLKAQGTSSFSPTSGLIGLHLKWLADSLNGLTGEELAPKLIELAKVPDATMRWIAVLALAKIRGGGVEIVAALKDALNDTDSEVRAAATWALAKVERVDAKDA